VRQMRHTRACSHHKDKSFVFAESVILISFKS
jgi:hypothetical protein